MVDGEDAQTEHAGVALSGQPRVRIIWLPRSVGAAQARNVGIEAAQGDWIALLDDDDEWLPDKLQCQYRLAVASQHGEPVVYCRYARHGRYGVQIRPRRLPEREEAIGDYLWCRRSFFSGEASLITSTLFARRSLLHRIPFKAELYRHQDSDWIIRASRQEDVQVDFAPRVLAILHADEDRPRISHHNDWHRSLGWIRDCRPLLSKKAYSGLVLGNLSAIAARQSDWLAIAPLLAEAVRHGQPTPTQLLAFFANWSVPAKIRPFLAQLCAQAAHFRRNGGGE